MQEFFASVLNSYVPSWVSSEAFSQGSNLKLKAKRKEKTVRARVARGRVSDLDLDPPWSYLLLLATKAVSSLCSTSLPSAGLRFCRRRVLYLLNSAGCNPRTKQKQIGF